jgi:hypothetical protein
MFFTTEDTDTYKLKKVGMGEQGWVGSPRSTDLRLGCEVDFCGGAGRNDADVSAAKC